MRTMIDQKDYDREIAKIVETKENHRDVDVDHDLAVDIAACVRRMTTSKRVILKCFAEKLLGE